MKPDLQFEKVLRRPVEICAAGAGLLAFLVLLSWVFDAWRIGALGREYIPMAPSTAWLMILLSGGIFMAFGIGSGHGNYLISDRIVLK